MAKDRFESFVTSVTLAHRYVQYIKKQEGLVFGLKGFHALCLYYLDKSPDGTTVTELSKRCGEDKATVSRALETLSSKGYVMRQDTVSGTHRRSRVKLTPEGRHVAERVNRLIEDIAAKIGEGFTDEQLDEFYRIFMIMDRRLADYCASIDRRRRNTRRLQG